MINRQVAQWSLQEGAEQALSHYSLSCQLSPALPQVLLWACLHTEEQEREFFVLFLTQVQTTPKVHPEAAPLESSYGY